MMPAARIALTAACVFAVTAEAFYGRVRLQSGRTVASNSWVLLLEVFKNKPSYIDNDLEEIHFRTSDGDIAYYPYEVAEVSLKFGKFVSVLTATVYEPFKWTRDTRCFSMAIDQSPPCVNDSSRMSGQEIPVERTPDMNLLLDRMNNVQNADEDCAVCFKSNPVTTAAILPCRHSFCAECITKLQSLGSLQQRCPLCRQSFTVGSKNPATDVVSNKLINEFFKRAIEKLSQDSGVGNGNIESVAIKGSTTFLPVSGDIDWIMVTKIKPASWENQFQIKFCQEWFSHAFKVPRFPSDQFNWKNFHWKPKMQKLADAWLQLETSKQLEKTRRVIGAKHFETSYLDATHLETSYFYLLNSVGQGTTTIILNHPGSRIQWRIKAMYMPAAFHWQYHIQFNTGHPFGIHWETNLTFRVNQLKSEGKYPLPSVYERLANARESGCSKNSAALTFKRLLLLEDEDIIGQLGVRRIQF